MMFVCDAVLDITATFSSLLTRRVVVMVSRMPRAESATRVTSARIWVGDTLARASQRSTYS